MEYPPPGLFAKFLLLLRLAEEGGAGWRERGATV